MICILYRIWGVGIQFINVNARLFTLLAPPLSPPDFRTRPVDRFAPPGHDKYVHLHGMARYNARKGPQLNGPHISDTIGSYLALPRCSMLRCLSNRPCPLNLLRASAEKRLAAYLHLVLSARSTSFIGGPVAVISLCNALAETNTPVRTSSIMRKIESLL